jgi:hypothetical protein
MKANNGAHVGPANPGNIMLDVPEASLPYCGSGLAMQNYRSI